MNSNKNKDIENRKNKLHRAREKKIMFNTSKTTFEYQMMSLLIAEPREKKKNE